MVKLWNTDINKFQLGWTQINKMYLWNTVVFWAVAASTLLNGIVTYWKADTNWSFPDSVWTSDWTINWATFTASWKINWAYILDWNNDWINTNYKNITSQLTVSVWFKTTQTSDWDIFSKYRWIWNQRSFISRLQADWKMHCYVSTDWLSITQDFETTNTWNDWLWHHFVFVNQWAWVWPMQIWIDWVNQVWTLTWPNSDIFNSINLDWAIWTTDSVNPTFALFDWTIDEPAIWNRALTSSEITELYNAGNWNQYPFTW